MLYVIYKTKRSSDEPDSPSKKTNTNIKYLKYKIKYINLKKKLNLVCAHKISYQIIIILTFILDYNNK